MFNGYKSEKIRTKQLPYGISDYARILKENFYYVDKTRFIETVEAPAPFLFLIRPRRFGKSLWLNTMTTYYDVLEASGFDTYFGILTFDRVEQDSTIVQVPNPAIRTVLFSYLAEGN